MYRKALQTSKKKKEELFYGIYLYKAANAGY